MHVQRDRIFLSRKFRKTDAKIPWQHKVQRREELRKWFVFKILKSLTNWVHFISNTAELAVNFINELV